MHVLPAIDFSEQDSAKDGSSSSTIADETDPSLDAADTSLSGDKINQQMAPKEASKKRIYEGDSNVVLPDLPNTRGRQLRSTSDADDQQLTDLAKLSSPGKPIEKRIVFFVFKFNTIELVILAYCIAS